MSQADFKSLKYFHDFMTDLFWKLEKTGDQRAMNLTSNVMEDLVELWNHMVEPHSTESVQASDAPTRPLGKRFTAQDFGGQADSFLAWASGVVSEQADIHGDGDQDWLRP